MRLIPFRRKNEDRTDEELLSEYLRTKNQEVLGALYTRYLHLVLGVCNKYLNDIEKSKDHTMLIYEKILNEVRKHEIRNFKSWLFVVTKNHCLVELRKKKTVGLTFAGDGKELSLFVENGSELNPIDRDEEIREKALYDCIEKLNEAQKECISMFYLSGKCYREIAGSLGIDEKSVKSHIQNGKRNLKICLEKKI